MINNQFILSLCVALTLSACGTLGIGGKKNAPSNEVVQDITRPPTVGSGAELPLETNPDETISYDKWQKEAPKKVGNQSQ